MYPLRAVRGPLYHALGHIPEVRHLHIINALFHGSPFSVYPPALYRVGKFRETLHEPKARIREMKIVHTG